MILTTNQTCNLFLKFTERTKLNGDDDAPRDDGGDDAHRGGHRHDALRDDDDALRGGGDGVLGNASWLV